VRATARALVPAAAARFGIVSDIDDTVIQSDATALLRMARHLLLGNARTRMPFAGVAAFYRALQAARAAMRRIPLFYVSSSPWNLYDLLIEIFEHNGIPLGPLMLRDWGLTTRAAAHAPRAHKGTAIARILDTTRTCPSCSSATAAGGPGDLRVVSRRYPGPHPRRVHPSIRRDDMRSAP
jgi:phosphatidate phosphatase APP1